jgi:hypothetical protein
VLVVAACAAPGPTSVPTLPPFTAALPSPTAVATATAPTLTSATADHPCVAAAPPRGWRHVIWIWFENKPSAGVLGSASAPYLTGLSKECASATDYHGVAHPSLPNYLAATSGSLHGVTDDAAPSAHPLPGASLFSQVSAAGMEWRAYNESMPVPCAQDSSGTYATKHNPALYYTTLQAECQRWDVGLDRLTTDLATDQLPAFAFVTPNLCNDMHDCPVATGDGWLRAMLPAVLGSVAYQRGDTAVFVTWDEDDGSHNNRVPLLVIAPSVAPATTITARLDHYGLLRTTEGMLGLGALGNAASAKGIPGL